MAQLLFDLEVAGFLSSHEVFHCSLKRLRNVLETATDLSLFKVIR